MSLPLSHDRPSSTDSAGSSSERWYALPYAGLRVSGRLALVSIVVCVLLGLLYIRTGLMLEVRWRNDPSASHGYFIPVVAAWLIYRRLRSNELQLPACVSRSDVATGMFAMLAGISLHLLATLITGVSMDGAGLILVLLGLVWIFGGQKLARRYGPALLFLVFMVPLPLAIQQPVGEALQNAVSIISEATLSLMGLPVYREGYMLHLPGHILEVAQGCSGLRQIMVFTAMSTFLGLLGDSRLHCVVMLLLTLPVAIVANTICITAMGLTAHYAGIEWTQGIFHDLEGLISSLIGMVILFGLSGRIMALLKGPRWSASDESVTPGLSNETSYPQVSNHSDEASAVPDGGTYSNNLRRRLTLVIGLLVFSIVIDYAAYSALSQLRATEQIPLQRPLAEFPRSLAGWTGIDAPVSREYFLYGDDHLNRVYRHDATGQTLTLWMIYTTDGRDRGHHPQVCMRSFGCQEDEGRKATVALPGEGQPADRFYFRRPAGTAGEWVTYWYHLFRSPVETEVTPGSMQALLGKFRTGRSGMTIQLFIPDRTEADSAAAAAFAAAVEATLADHLLPTYTTRSTHRGAFAIFNENNFRESQ